MFISPEILEKAREASTPGELAEIAWTYGKELSANDADALFAELQGGLNEKELSNAENGCITTGETETDVDGKAADNAQIDKKKPPE